MTKIGRGAILLFSALLPFAAGCDFTIVEGMTAPGSSTIALTLTPTTATVAPGGTVKLSATVTGTNDSTVMWSIDAGPGNVYVDGLYQAPATIDVDPTTVTVRARAGADTSVTRTATITVTRNGPGGQIITVSITPSTATVKTGATYQFTATVTGSTNTGVTWSVVAGPGQISPLGRYLAPNLVAGGNASVTIQATAAADPAAIGRATVTVEGAGSNEVCFERDILPMINSTCGTQFCHDAESHKDDYVLNSYDGIMRGIAPGNLNDSEIFEKVTETDPKEKMMPPPPASRMSAQQIELLRRWILEGARNTTCAPSPNQCDTSNVTYSATIQPVLVNYCVGCHTGGTLYNGYVSLATHAEVKAVAASGRLYGAIAHQPGFEPMPQSLPKFDDCTIAQFKKWIDLGAPEN